ncbi:uncharacterized protein LOC116251381 [Nymphaea colorata]|nr:uncharacterized protein LOC116251381 [Nymphaea colorata]
MDPSSPHEESGHEESGWTSILCDSLRFCRDRVNNSSNNDDFDDDNDDGGGGIGSDGNYDVDDEDDVSLVSDASSGGYKNWQDSRSEDEYGGGISGQDHPANEDDKHDNECYDSCSNDGEGQTTTLHGAESDNGSACGLMRRAVQQADSGGDSKVGVQSDSSAISLGRRSIKTCKWNFASG